MLLFIMKPSEYDSFDKPAGEIAGSCLASTQVAHFSRHKNVRIRTCTKASARRNKRVGDCVLEHITLK